MNPKLPIVVVGGGPAGLMAAQVLVDAGCSVQLFDAMPSVGRKFLLAGKGGLNLTHSEEREAFAKRYGSRRNVIDGWLKDFDSRALRSWAHSLGIQTFVGSSGRVFPVDMKAAPLLRAWLHRLRHPAGPGGVQFFMRHRWKGWTPEGLLTFDTPDGVKTVQAGAVVLALGGGSWSRLGSDGAWAPLLADKGVAVSTLMPSNCGFDLPQGWTPHFASRYAGQPFKSVAISFDNGQGNTFNRRGEFVATATGVEGSLIYAASSLLRDEILLSGAATFSLDLLPDLGAEHVLAQVLHPRGSRSLSNHLKSRLNLDGIKSAILHELLPKSAFADPRLLATAIKSLPVTVGATRPLDEAISTAGGVMLEDLTPDLMCMALPGLFCAGEMLDWEAPTGGYLLQACFSSGQRAGRGVLEYLRHPS